MPALLVVVLGVSTPAAAEVLTMRQVDSTNLHMADRRGAIHTRVDLTITVELGKKGRATVASKGSRGEHNLDVIDGKNYNTDENTTWATTWTGTWQRAKGELVLDLALAKDTCSSIREDGGTKTARTCKAARKSAVMRCTSTSVTLQLGEKQRAVAAWQCSPDDPRDMGESPTSWVFAKDQCIQVHGGRKTPRSYAPCAP